MEGKYPEATNYQYIIKCKDAPLKKKLFINNVNLYLNTRVVEEITSFQEEDLWFEVFATLCDRGETSHEQLRNVIVLDPGDECFMDTVIGCDILIFDISQEWLETRKFLKYLEKELENSKIEKKKEIILVSNIMTWAQTQESFGVLTDLSYRKRKPHSCFTSHLALERDVINLSKKYKDHISSVVICPGIIYGGKQDILHFLYKKCYFNNVQLDIFSPGTNYLPMIYIEDFVRIMIKVIRNPDANVPYILAVQPHPIEAKTVISSLAEAVGGPETRIKICTREEIFMMNEDLMTQRVFNHLTLNLRLESEFLKTFDFEMTGSNIDENSHKLADEFYRSRDLKPLKILIDGSPYAYQSELAEMLATFYSLHRIQSDGFLENMHQRLTLKVKEAEDYLLHMKSIETSEKLYSEMIEKVQAQVVDWKGKIDSISDLLKTDSKPAFHEMQDCVLNRLTSFGCAKHQGYVMDGFQLDSEMASFLFLEPSHEGFEFNEMTKPDYIILLNRNADHDDICAELETKMTIDDEQKEENEMKKKLKEYYNSHYENVSLLNFFLDRDIIPIEITFDREQSISDLRDIFESLKSKIGSPHNYRLSKSEQEELEKLKMEIVRKEAAKKTEVARLKAFEDLEKKEEQIKLWTQEMLEKKRQDIEEIEKHSLPTRHYLMKYVMPNITAGLTEMAKVRPKNAVEFLSNFMLSQIDDVIEDDPDHEEVMSEFRKIVKFTKCNK